MRTVDCGESLHGIPNACVPLHISMSVLLSSTPQNSQRRLLEAAAQLAQGVMLDITPRAGPACPASLSSFDKVATECAVCLPVFYVTSFFNMQLQARLHLGLPNSNSAHLPPLLASVHDQHCILMLAASFCPDRHGPRMFERFRALVGGKRAEKPKQRPNYKVQKAVGKKPALAVRRALRRVEHRRTDVFTDVSEMQVDSGFRGAADFLSQQKDWAKSLIPGQHISVRHQWCPFAAGFKLMLWCKSCLACQKQQGWKGYIEYSTESKKLTRRFTPASAHGDFDAVVSTWNPLTRKTEAALVAQLHAKPEASAVDLLKTAQEHQDTSELPQAFLQRWKKNKRSRLGGEKQATRQFAWTRSDWEQLERTMGKVDDHPKADVPNKLLVADRAFGGNDATVVLLNPAVFQAVLKMTTNKNYIKLSGDGTHKLTHDDWSFITLGVLSKHYSSDGRTYAFRTTYTPLAFAISNTEQKSAYDLLFAVAIRMGHALCGIDLQLAVRQYHADLHPGEEAARREAFPNAARVADFAHVIGATHPKKNQATKPTLAGFRSGLFALAKKHISVPGQRLLPLLQHTVHLLRVVPTALVFHCIANLLFDTLLAQQPPERSLVRKLQTHHFTRVLAAEARARFELISWPGDPDAIWLAPWWTGLQRVQPGSASGTQAQES